MHRREIYTCLQGDSHSHPLFSHFLGKSNTPPFHPQVSSELARGFPCLPHHKYLTITTGKPRKTLLMKPVWKDALSALPPVLSCAFIKEHPGVHVFLTVVSQESEEMFISVSRPLELSKVFYLYLIK